MQSKTLLALALALATLFPQSSARAVGTSTWTQTNENDWKDGTFENVVATSLGDLKLSRAVKTLLEQEPRVSSVNALAQAPDGTVFAGTGPRGVLLQLKGETVTTVAKVDDPHIFSVVIDAKGAVLAGTGGQSGRILRFDRDASGKLAEKGVEVFKADGVQYVWAVRQTPDGNLYAATGPTGQLWEIKTDGAKRVVVDTDENNLLSLASDGKDTLYAGTDPSGLVYRVNRRTGESFVLYDAAEAEVTALALDARGNLFAGTAEARDDQPAVPAAAATGADTGRPEAGAGAVPIPSNRPTDPAPPKVPDPTPGQPDPIPKGTISLPAQVAPPIDGGGAGANPPPAKAGRPAGGQGVTVVGLESVAIASADDSPAPGAPSPAPAPGAPGDSPQPSPNPPPAPGPTPNPNPQPPAPGKPEPGPGPAPAPPNPGPGPGPDPSPSPKPGPGTPAPVAPEPSMLGRPPIVSTAGTGQAANNGNAVYRIDPDGFVTEIFRQPLLVLALVERGGTLLIATGGPAEGQIFQVDPSAEETIVLGKVNPKQVLSLLPTEDGRLYMGLANVGGIAVLSAGLAAEGKYTSPVLDAQQVSRFGNVMLHGSLPKGTSIRVATRSGNVRDSAQKSWSAWSEDAPAAEFIKVAAPSARFLQYRLTFSAADGGKVSPVVEDVSVAYQLPNLAPQVKAVKITPVPDLAALAASMGADVVEATRIPTTRKQTIAWEASDANSDALIYSLWFRRGPAAPWILLKEKIKETQFEWDTRSVADGRYEVKVVASDAAANPPGKGRSTGRVSDPVGVDNTPPAVGDLTWRQKGQAVAVELTAVDRTSTVAALDYAINSSREWQAVLPTDNIFDGPQEKVTFALPALTPGTHQLTVRATDAKGNQAFENVFVTVEPPAARAP